MAIQYPCRTQPAVGAQCRRARVLVCANVLSGTITCASSNLSGLTGILGAPACIDPTGFYSPILAAIA